MAQPGSLGNLALETLGKYIYDLCSKLTRASLPKPSRSKAKKRKMTGCLDIKSVKEICSRLHQMIAEMPVNVANDLTNKLLDNVDNWDFEVGKCKKGSQDEEIYEQVVISVIHPAVTRIEPGLDILDCSDIFPETVFCSSLCVTIILKNVHTLANLRRLNILHASMKCNFSQIDFPNQLVEFAGRSNDALLVRIASSCPRLKYLDVFGSKGVTDASVTVMLKMQNLEKLNISETKISNKGMKSYLNGLFEKYGKSPALKYLSFSCNAFHYFTCPEIFPELKISLQLHPNPFNTSLGISHLCTFKNICELQIGTSLNDLNKLLRHIGGQLVFLDAEIEHFGPLGDDDDDEEDAIDDNWDIAEILKVGQYCTFLKCLHISISYYFFPRMLDYVRPPLPGFASVHCLTIEIEDEDNFRSEDYFNFLVSQCVNAKKVSFAFDRRVFNVFNFLSNLAQTGTMKNLELICFQPFCTRCSIADLEEEDYFSQDKINELLQLLIIHCPNLSIVGLDPKFERNCVYNPQRLKFVPTWCRCK